MVFMHLIIALRVIFKKQQLIQRAVSLVPYDMLLLIVSQPLSFESVLSCSGIILPITLFPANFHDFCCIRYLSIIYYICNQNMKSLTKWSTKSNYHDVSSRLQKISTFLKIFQLKLNFQRCLEEMTKTLLLRTKVKMELMPLLELKQMRL